MLFSSTQKSNKSFFSEFLDSLKSVFFVIGVLAVILVVLPTFLSSKFAMSRSVEINAPVTVVFRRLTDLNEYVRWNPFPEGDPTNQTNVSGAGVGSSLTWKGEKTGEGKMTITEVEPDKNVDIRMEFYKPMSGEGTVKWITNAKSDSRTEFIWTFEQDLSYFKRYFGLIMGSMMGKHFEKGLVNYKNIVEAQK